MLKEVFVLAKVNAEDGTLVILPGEYNSYGEAQAAIDEQPAGLYQVQKWFRKEAS